MATSSLQERVTQGTNAVSFHLNDYFDIEKRGSTIFGEFKAVMKIKKIYIYSF
jgi:hypothetical protein